MKLVDRVREYLEQRSQSLAGEFYEECLTAMALFNEDSESFIESPVEQLFLIEWTRLNFMNPTLFDLYPQYQHESVTGKYRLDFCVSFTLDAYQRHCPPLELPEFNSIQEPLLGVEIDGHIWHEKTPHQVQYHKERERFLIEKGWKLLRFTGAEIFRDPNPAVIETRKFACELRNQYFDSLREKINAKK